MTFLICSQPSSLSPADIVVDFLHASFSFVLDFFLPPFLLQGSFLLTPSYSSTNNQSWSQKKKPWWKFHVQADFFATDAFS